MLTINVSDNLEELELFHKNWWEKLDPVGISHVQVDMPEVGSESQEHEAEDCLLAVQPAGDQWQEV
jgi:hypothetical protein